MTRLEDLLKKHVNKNILETDVKNPQQAIANAVKVYLDHNSVLTTTEIKDALINTFGYAFPEHYSASNDYGNGNKYLRKIKGVKNLLLTKAIMYVVRFNPDIKVTILYRDRGTRIKRPHEYIFFKNKNNLKSYLQRRIKKIRRDKDVAVYFSYME